jgi:serine protease
MEHCSAARALLFLGVLGTTNDPKPDIQTIQNINDFYNFIRQNNNATWKNFDIISTFSGKKIKIPFWIQGWPKIPYQGDLEVKLGRLPKGAKVELQIANHLREGTKVVRMKKARAKGRLAHYIVTPTGTSALRNIRLKPGVRSQANLLMTLPPEVRPGAYDIAVLQKIDGKEVGRVSRRLVITKRR